MRPLCDDEQQRNEESIVYCPDEHTLLVGLASFEAQHRYIAKMYVISPVVAVMCMLFTFSIGEPGRPCGESLLIQHGIQPRELPAGDI